jgi:hypothetical protein
MNDIQKLLADKERLEKKIAELDRKSSKNAELFGRRVEARARELLGPLDAEFNFSEYDIEEVAQTAYDVAKSLFRNKET